MSALLRSKRPHIAACNVLLFAFNIPKGVSFVKAALWSESSSIHKENRYYDDLHEHLFVPLTPTAIAKITTNIPEEIYHNITAI